MGPDQQKISDRPSYLSVKHVWAKGLRPLPKRSPETPAFRPGWAPIVLKRQALNQQQIFDQFAGFEKTGGAKFLKSIGI
jgi:hypothetical protein